MEVATKLANAIAELAGGLGLAIGSDERAIFNTLLVHMRDQRVSRIGDLVLEQKPVDYALAAEELNEKDDKELVEILEYLTCQVKAVEED